MGRMQAASDSLHRWVKFHEAAVWLLQNQIKPRAYRVQQRAFALFQDLNENLLNIDDLYKN